MALLGRQGSPQLDSQSQSFSRSYGSGLPTSLTYMRLTLQRLLTLDTGCGYRVRSFPNMSSVYTRVYTRYLTPSTASSRTGSSTETHTTGVALFHNAATFHRARRFQECLASVKQKRELFPGLRPAASAWLQLLGTINRLNSLSRGPGLVKEQSPHSLSPAWPVVHRLRATRTTCV